MEDAHIAILSLVEEIEKIKKDKENNNTDNKDEQNSEKGNDEDTYKLENDMSFFGVFDGHSGGVVSKYASKELHKILVNDNDFKSKNYEKALKSAFFKLDDQMQKGIY